MLSGYTQAMGTTIQVEWEYIIPQLFMKIEINSTQWLERYLYRTWHVLI